MFFSNDEDHDGSMKTGKQTINIDGDSFTFKFYTSGARKGQGISGYDDKKIYMGGKMIAADKERLLILSGTGEVIDPDEGIAAIGSGGNYALAAARALVQNTELSAAEIAEKSLAIAGQICIYTNDHVTVEEI